MLTVTWNKSEHETMQIQILVYQPFVCKYGPIIRGKHKANNSMHDKS